MKLVLREFAERMERKQALAIGVILVACVVMLLQKSDIDIGVILKKKPDVNVTITILKSAAAEGAVCLDGSPPAYYFDKGSSCSGRKNWVVHLEGGGWCNNATNCLERSNSSLGSSNNMTEKREFWGILSKQRKHNPDFYNWNRVWIMYCDGASFTGDKDEKVDSNITLHYRGAKIFDAVITDLLTKGMKKATNVFFTGCSAGGLGNILLCHKFRHRLDILPKQKKRINLKCLSDAGYFVNVKDISGKRHIEALYKEIVTTHGSAKNLPKSCTSQREPDLASQCFFPQNVAGQLESPLFILNAAYDSWQIPHILAPETSYSNGSWDKCRRNMSDCATDQLNTIEEFRTQFLAALKELGSSPSRGMFIISCHVHCQITTQANWHAPPNSPVLDGSTIAEAVGDWYYDRRPVQLIDDCAYPCLETCRNSSFV